MPPADHCPLCPTKPGGEPSEIPAPSYDVVVFENRFPSFTQTAPDVPSEVDGNPLWPQRPAVGRCEVVCFTSDHNASFGSLPVSRVRTVIEAWADRTATLSALPGVEQVFPFENRGKEIGVTLQHPHGQIYAYPFVTPRTASLITRAGAHRQRTGRDLMGDVLDSERKSGARVVLDGDAWTCFVPAAARWPVEAHLVPHRAVPDFAALNDAERDELASALPGPALPAGAGLRRADGAALHRRVAPGPRPHRTRPHPPAPAAVLAAPGAGQAEVPRRVRVGHRERGSTT